MSRFLNSKILFSIKNRSGRLLNYFHNASQDTVGPIMPVRFDYVMIGDALPHPPMIFSYQGLAVTNYPRIS